MAELSEEILAGEVLLEGFMKPLGLSARQLAADIGAAASRISVVVNGKRQTIPDTACRLGVFFSMEPRFWMNLQIECHMRSVTRALRESIGPRISVCQTTVGYCVDARDSRLST